MNDTIIKAAQQAGFANQYPTAPMLEMFERFYAIAFKAGMERAAEICEARDMGDWTREDCEVKRCAEAIRAHAQNQPKNEHDGSVV